MYKYKEKGAFASSVRPWASKARQNKGITLIALIITIIVMLILVGVTISMAINGGLFDYAGKATGETKNAINAEQELANGKVQIDGVWYDSIDDYLIGKPSSTVKINLSIAGTKSTTVPIPEGFIYKEGTIDTGYVIINETDGNEFVWVPVEKNQKMTLEIESETDIKEVILKDPYGDTVLTIADGEIETTYNNTNISPTINGTYKAKVTNEKETVEKTLVVRSLYAYDAWSEYYTSEEYAEGFSQLLFGELQTKEEFWLFMVSQKYGTLEDAYAETGCTTLDELIIYSVGATFKENQDVTDYTESVNKNGGFYIARYEAGASTPRMSGKSSDTVSAIIATNGVPVSKEGYIPYFCITFDQALGLAEGMYISDEFDVSLLTLAAGDRTLGWIYETGGKSIEELAFDNASWGNYKNSEFEITKGKYIQSGSTTIELVSGIYKKTKDETVALTTGASTRNSVNNIFDLAGNAAEWLGTTYLDCGRVRPRQLCF